MDSDVARVIRAFDELARRLACQGVPRAEIQRQLMARGLNEAAASKILEHVDTTAGAPAVPAPVEAPPRRRYGLPDMNDEDAAGGGLEEMRARLAKAEARADILHGALITGAGVLFTAVTYSLASGTGGIYVVATGAILLGVRKLVRGLMNL
jgi:hypothetical protein